MGRKQDIRARQGCESGVFDEVVVVADQDSRAPAAGQLEHGVGRTGGQERRDEDMELSVAGPTSIGHGDDVRVVKSSGGVDFDKASADRGIELFGPGEERLSCQAVWDRLRDGTEFITIKSSQVPVAADAT